MRKLLLVYLLLFFYCEREKNDFENDWVSRIDSQVESFEKTQTIKKIYINNLENEAVEEVSFFKENKNGVSKIEGIYSIENSFIIKQKLCLKNDKIIFSFREWFSPLIYKSRKKENSPCCSVSETKSYFYSKDSILNFSREKKIYSTEEFTTFNEVLKDEVYENDRNSYYDFEYYQNLINELNERFPNTD